MDEKAPRVTTDPGVVSCEIVAPLHEPTKDHVELDHLKDWTDARVHDALVILDAAGNLFQALACGLGGRPKAPSLQLVAREAAAVTPRSQPESGVIALSAELADPRLEERALSVAVLERLTTLETRLAAVEDDLSQARAWSAQAAQQTGPAGARHWRHVPQLEQLDGHPNRPSRDDTVGSAYAPSTVDSSYGMIDESFLSELSEDDRSRAPSPTHSESSLARARQLLHRGSGPGGRSGRSAHRSARGGGSGGGRGSGAGPIPHSFPPQQHAGATFGFAPQAYPANGNAAQQAQGPPPWQRQAQPSHQDWEAADRERVRRNAAQGVTSSLEALVEIVGGDSGSADERSPSVPLRVARVSGFLNEVMLTSENGTAPPEDAVEKLQGLLQDIQSLKETMKEDEQHAAAAGAAAGARHGVGRGAAAATAFIAAA